MANVPISSSVHADRIQNTLVRGPYAHVIVRQSNDAMTGRNFPLEVVKLTRIHLVRMLYDYLGTHWLHTLYTVTMRRGASLRASVPRGDG